MKTYKIHIILIGILLSAGMMLYSQDYNLFKMSETASSPGDLSLPPLDSLIEKAVANSGAYQYYAYEKSIREQEMHISQKEWFDFLSIEANARYGVNDQIFVNQMSFEDSYNLNSSGTQMRYYAGITAKFPLSLLISRSNRNKMARLTMDKASEEARKTKQEVSTLIVTLYYQIKLSFKGVVVK